MRFSAGSLYLRKELGFLDKEIELMEPLVVRPCQGEHDLFPTSGAPSNCFPRFTHIRGVDEIHPWQIEEDVFQEFGIGEDSSA